MFKKKTPERVEKLELNALFDYKQYSKHKQDIEIALNNDRKFKVIPDDNFSLFWEFNVEYYNVVAQFNAVRRILEDENLVVDINLSVDTIDSIFVSFIDDVRRCQEALKTRALSD